LGTCASWWKDIGTNVRSPIIFFDGKPELHSALVKREEEEEEIWEEEKER